MLGQIEEKKKIIIMMMMKLLVKSIRVSVKKTVLFLQYGV